MKMELIQPFINSLDAVLAETMGCSAEIADVTMEAGNYERTGIAALVGISGEIEGRVILDMDMAAAQQATSDLTGAVGSLTEETARETVCELTNMVIGNAVTQLNNTGFKFRVHPPEVYVLDGGLQGAPDTEAVVLRFETPKGAVYLNIAVRYKKRRSGERTPAPVLCP
jgi:chemotaxis protein CheX